ncbi:MAG: YqeG family HAD IIIA-type phosphatase [Desulfitobacteriaceae bacterium]|nr:YqeG family HAD IIIA-type phosphatase [Desulfitobacteriaceae bacterium]MDD4347110.1 YqeG family HAD IIIA-type phosphatase [Desulfitobacteriaceae bacterium]MDD4401585.1 YqeG family HAD IIIA-type phosphatase [Desulfitobacteriaceae bacterium]
MLELFSPTFQAESLNGISIERLVRDGIRGLIIDLDNTMTPWNDPEISPGVQKWFAELQAAGIQSCVVSNNKHRGRVAVVAEKLGIPFVFRATKPRGRAFRTGMKIMQTGPKDTAVIGDQLFTDILGGNRLNLYTILVVPISKHEFVGTRFLRWMEKILIWLIKHFAPAKNIALKRPD